MKILIVGGTGMIGGHTGLYLHSRGHDVTLAGRRRPKDVSLLEKFPFVGGDYINGDYTLETLAKFDAIVFAAGSDPRHVPQNEQPDDHYVHANGVAIPKFARLARDAGVKRFIHIGSFYPHIKPELVETAAYVRSRKLAADGVIALARSGFHACSIDGPFIVGTVPGMTVPMFVALTQYAKGKLDIPPYAPTGGTNFMSVKSLSNAISGALEHSEAVSGKALLLGDENLTFAEYFGMFFRAMGNNTPIPALEKEHPLMPDSALWAGRSVVAYEPDPQVIEVLGGYSRNNVRDAVQNIVAQYRSF